MSVKTKREEYMPDAIRGFIIMLRNSGERCKHDEHAWRYFKHSNQRVCLNICSAREAFIPGFGWIQTYNLNDILSFIETVQNYADQ